MPVRNCEGRKRLRHGGTIHDRVCYGVSGPARDDLCPLKPPRAAVQSDTRASEDSQLPPRRRPSLASPAIPSVRLWSFAGVAKCSGHTSHC